MIAMIEGYGTAPPGTIPAAGRTPGERFLPTRLRIKKQLRRFV